MLARRVFLAAVAAGALVLAACGGDNQSKGADRTTVPPVNSTQASDQMTAAPPNLQSTFTITAKNVAFSPTKIDAPANQELTVTFDNQDAGVAHNLHIKVPEEQKTDVKQGANQDTLKFTVTKPGKYEFMCDVHPTMKGQIVVH